MANIVVVDDEEGLRASLELALLAEGHVVTPSCDGIDAIEKIEAIKKDGSSVDVVITDVQMPRLTGDALIARLSKEHPEIAVMAITGHGDKETVIKLMKAGCQDYIDKPVNTKQLIETVDVLVNEQLKRSKQFKSLVHTKDERVEYLSEQFTNLKKVVEEAVATHEELLHVDLDATDIDVAFKMRPIMDVGGDLLAVETRPDGSTALLVADVAGHDMSSSYHVVLLKTLFMKYCEGVEAPSLFFNSVNSVLYSGKNNRMITAQLLIIDEKNEELTICNAGHPPAFLWSQTLESLRMSGSGGDVIGLLQDAEYTDVIYGWHPGDSMMLYTDGLCDLKKVDGPTGKSETLALSGLGSLFEKYHSLELRYLVEAVWLEALGFSKHKVTDDLLLVAVSYKGGK